MNTYLLRAVLLLSLTTNALQCMNEDAPNETENSQYLFVVGVLDTAKMLYTLIQAYNPAQDGSSGDFLETLHDNPVLPPL